MKNKSVQYLPWLVCLLGGLFYFYEYVLRVTPSVMPHQLTNAYQLDAASFGNLTGIYYSIYIPIQLLVGVLLDRFGPRRLVTMALLSCCIGSYLFASSHWLWVAFVGRFLIGFGSAFAFVGALKLVSIWFSGHRFAVITGAITGLGMLGGVLGDVLLTSLMQHAGWRLTCYVSSLVGLVLLLLIFFSLSFAERRAESFFQLTLLPSVKTGCLGLWHIMQNTQIWINAALGCLLYIPISGFAEVWGIQFLERFDRFPEPTAAAAVSMIFLGWVLGAPLSAWISNVIAQRRLPITVGATGATILLSIVLYVPQLNAGFVFFFLFLFGVFSSVQVLVFAISRELVPNVLTGTVVGLTNTVTMLAGLSVMAIGAILKWAWKGSHINGAPIYHSDTFQLAFSILPMCLVAAVFLSFYLEDTYCREKLESDGEVSIR